MTLARSQEDILAGVLPVVVGGSTRLLPTMKIRPARAWKATLAVVLSETGKLDVDFTRPESLSVAASLTGDKILDLVLSYDTTDALGGREWLEEHADDSEMYAALRAILECSYPFVTDLRTALSEVGMMVAAQAFVTPPSESPTSTSGRSPTGTSTRKTSKAA